MAVTLGAYLVQSRLDNSNSIRLCMECQHTTCTNYSRPQILSLVWFCLLFAIFQQVSDLVTSIGFLSTTEYSSKLLHLPRRPQQPVSHPIFIISSKYTSHHGLSILQPRNFSWCHTYPLTSVSVPSGTALLQHGIHHCQCGCQSTRHTVNSSPGQLIMRPTRHKEAADSSQRGGQLVTSKQTSKHQSCTAAAVIPLPVVHDRRHYSNNAQEIEQKTK